jgi:hypothetical protein
LPWQRTAADTNEPALVPSPELAAPTLLTASEDELGPSVAKAPRAASKRPVRDSKSDALRARLGAAKAALAEAQAKRAIEIAAEAIAVPIEQRSEVTQPEMGVAALRDTTLQPLASGETEAPQLRAADTTEPIRTLTVARVLARQGYYDRSLSIYDALLADNATDAELRAEADGVRAQKASAS